MTIKNLVFAAILILMSVAAQAQKISKRMVAKNTETGMIYFMRPQEMPQHAKGQGIKGPMLYDITILTDNDTVAFMMTVCSKEPIIMEQADFISGDGSRTSHKIQKIYLNARKKYFVGRYRCQLTKAHLNSLYAADAPFIVDFGNNTQFAIKKGNWANEKRVYSMVYKLSELNK